MRHTQRSDHITPGARRGCALLAASLVAAGAAQAAAASTPHSPADGAVLRADGVWHEWEGVDPSAIDPPGDASGAFDLGRVWARGSGGVAYVAFEAGAVRNLQAGDPSDGTVVLELAVEGGSTVRIDFRAKDVTLDGQPSSWRVVGVEAMPTHASDRFEVGVDLSAAGASAGARVEARFSGSDALASPVRFVMADDAPRPPRSPARPASADFRLASINTERGQLTFGELTPTIARVVDAVNADIYCFQEEYDASASAIRERVNAIDPLETGEAWNVVKFGDVAVASHFPLIGVPIGDESAVGAVVRVTPEHAVLVISVHPKCCGYAGSDEDRRRVRQMSVVRAAIARFRAGEISDALAPYAAAPVIVAGDWNLVGSRTPLDLMTDADAGPGLTDMMPALPDGSRVTTWRGRRTSSGSFFPGRLDLIAYDAPALGAVNSFLLDTATLPAAWLAQLGLRRGDSAALDHLVLVADLAFGPAEACPDDLTGDMAVTIADVAAAVARGQSPGEVRRVIERLAAGACR